ncbi:MAG TPA: VOC family protein [Geminicoccaceae bacterium]|nr:VOC family protein [Geminicoccaceae bacterium]
MTGTSGMLRGWIAHLDLTVSELAVSVPFYDKVLAHLRLERLKPTGTGPGRPVWHAKHEDLRLFGIALCEAGAAQRGKRHDRYAPGLHHVAFHAASREDVDRLYRLLLGMGATILDPPADYPQYGPVCYAVFFADPDGLKLEFVYMA